MGKGAGRGQGWQLCPKWNFPSPAWDERRGGCVVGCSSQHGAVPTCHTPRGLRCRAPWGSAQRGRGLLPSPGTSPSQRAHAAILGPAGTAGVIFHYKSPSPLPSSLLHEELRKQRCEPALVHHSRGVPTLPPPAPATLAICCGRFPGGILPLPAPGLQLLSFDFPPGPSWAGAELAVPSPVGLWS